MNPLIPKSHQVQPLLVVALLAASAEAARAQATPPNAGTVEVQIISIDPYGIRVVNDFVTMNTKTTASAGAVDARVDTTLRISMGGFTYASGMNHFNLPKNTSQTQTDSLSVNPLGPGDYAAGITASMSAPGTTTLGALAMGGFTVVAPGPDQGPAPGPGGGPIGP